MRTLEAELGQYTDEDDLPRDHEAMVRPGGLVRLNETDETPRYLGPSSGIAMTRIVMDEAKRYTDSQRISQLIPEVQLRRQAAAAGPVAAVSMMSMRSQSFSMPPSAISQKKSYPMISAVPAEKPPTRGIADKLFEVYYQRGMLCTNGMDPLPGSCGVLFTDIRLQARFLHRYSTKRSWRKRWTTSITAVRTPISSS